MSTSSQILLCELWERTSARGTNYLSGFLGKASLVAFLEERDGKRIWKVYATTPRPKAEGSSK